MPFYRSPGLGLVHMKIGGRKDKIAPPCKAPFEWQHLGVTHHCCMKPSGYACDAKVGDEGKACDMPLCSEHAHQVGKNEHLCPKHKAEQVQQQPELF